MDGVARQERGVRDREADGRRERKCKSGGDGKRATVVLAPAATLASQFNVNPLGAIWSN